MPSQLVWLITGATSGIGYQLALAALKRGEKVIATGRSRSIANLEPLKAEGADVLELDVTSSLDSLHEIAKKAIAFHGRIDVLINNAGYATLGTLEETTPEETYNQFNVHVFGWLNVTRAFLPYMRERKSGIVAFIGSLYGWIPVPYAGLYVTTKWALRGLSETLHAEISHLGLKSICFDFGWFRTPILHDTQRLPRVERIPDYKPVVDQVEGFLGNMNDNQPGDPKKAANVVIDVIRGEGLAAGKSLPTSLGLGTDAYEGIKKATEDAMKRTEEWKEVTCSTDF